MSSTNKLKKPHVSWNSTLRGNEDTKDTMLSSRTMTIATSISTATASVSSIPLQPQPLTATEQYWATRALRAEALLEAQETHKKEVRTMGYAQDMKRERELSLLAKEHKEKHAALERLLTFLLILIAMLVVLIVYLATHYTRHSMLLQYKQQERWWSAIGASHFTIPILSPFTSVVEQETSVIGAKLMGTLAAITACLAYLAFRHWLVSQAKSTTSSTTTSVTSAAIATVSRAIDR
ncbi:hypothetical protein BDZ97DRAFT_621626 [Flammula alnicola]|nr:hypothetical protein BDZ97DRAFT_621626 [Flammula alnicola]